MAAEKAVRMALGETNSDMWQFNLMATNSANGNNGGARDKYNQPIYLKLAPLDPTW